MARSSARSVASKPASASPGASCAREGANTTGGTNMPGMDRVLKGTAGTGAGAAGFASGAGAATISEAAAAGTTGAAFSAIGAVSAAAVAAAVSLVGAGAT